MANCLNCGKVNPPSKSNRPRKYCSKKCANKFLHKKNYVKQAQPGWGSKSKLIAEDRERRREEYEWCCCNMYSPKRIEEEYGFKSVCVWDKARSLGIKPKIIKWSGKNTFFTKEQAERIVNENVTPEHNNEFLRTRRKKAKLRSKSYRKKLHVKKRQNERRKKRREEDPAFRLRKNVSNSVYRALVVKQGLSKGGSTFEHLPYTPKELKEHIEEQFDENMSWENYGTYWELDHIVPQAALVYDSFEHPNFHECWDLKNLRPLEKTKNTSKSSFFNGRKHYYKK